MVCTGSWRSSQRMVHWHWLKIHRKVRPHLELCLNLQDHPQWGGKNQKGTPWECGFSLHSATIDNFCLVFLQWLNKTKIKKNKKPKKEKKMTRPNSLPLLPPWGVQSCFFVCFFLFFWFCGFLFSGSLLVFLQWLNKTKIQKTKKTQKKTQWPDPTLCHYSPLRVCNLVFLCFFVFLVSCLFCFFVFWFVVGFLKGSGPRPLCQFSHFRGCKLAFGWFYYLLWSCGSIRKQCKKLWQNAGITGGKLGGVGHKLGNFVCLCNLEKRCLNKCKNIGSQWMCRTDFDIDILGSNPWISTCSNTLKDSLEKEWCISLKWVLPSTSACLL